METRMTTFGTKITLIALCLVGLGCDAKEPEPRSENPGLSARPKNILLMIGDGMGPEQIRAGRLFARNGELALDRVDASPGMMTTHEASGEITDSAAAATALATGHKTHNYAIAVDVDGSSLETSLERAKASGMATGILTSVYIVDATPGVWAAHAADRGSYAEIAIQQARAGVDVILGGGRSYYLPEGEVGTGGPDLIEELVAGGYEFVETAQELATSKTPDGRILGLFSDEELTYALDRQQHPGLEEPSLAQMTAKAIEVLREDPDGFFLMVEGGTIDWRGHDRDAAGVVQEMLAFDNAVAVALGFAASSDDTLLVITADHETGDMDFGADPNLRFIAGTRATTEFIQGAIDREELTAEEALFNYAGIGDTWPELTDEESAAIEKFGMNGIADVLSARAGVTWGWSGSETAGHTAQKIPIYALGPGSDLFDGDDLDNTDVGRLLLDAVTAD
jgi:alkaline phosphatase